MHYNTLLRTALEAALLAGDAILKVYANQNIGVELKADQSPITLADKAAHQVIFDKLSATNIPVLSEEGLEIPYDERKNWERLWLVDPLDGTKEFIKRSGEFTVNIALIENSAPVLGVVFVPVLGMVYYTGNNGAYKSEHFQTIAELFDNAQKLPLNIQNDAFIVAASVSHPSPETDNYIKSIDTHGKELKVINKGSSIKLCMVAEGSVDCYPRLGKTMEWDTAAGHAILLNAGRNLCELPDRQQLIYNKPSLVNPWFCTI